MTKVKGLNLCNATCGVGRRMAKTVAPEKVSRLDREFLENGSKKLTKLFAAIFFLFLIGVGNVWGADGDVAYTLQMSDYSSGTKKSAYAESSDLVFGTAPNQKTWTIPGNATLGNYFAVGGKSCSETGRVITGKSSIDNVIKQVNVNYSGITNGKSSSLTVDSAKLEVGNSGFSSITETVKVTGLKLSSSSSASHFSFTPASSNWASGKYYRITIYCTTTGSKNSHLDITSIEFIEGSAGTSYTLTFKEWDGGGTASGSPSTGSVTANATSFSFGATEPSKTGHTIEGFYTNTSASSGVKVANSSRQFVASVTDWTNGSSQYTKGANANLYIKWSPKVCAITLDKGTSGTADGSVSYTYGNSTMTGEISHATKTGYHLDGYYTAASSGTKILNADGTLAGNDISVSTTTYTSGGNWAYDGTSLTLYAQWTIDNYTVHWKVNDDYWEGVSHGSPSTDANYNTKPATIPTAPVSNDCDGTKVFVGWTNSTYSHASTAPTILFSSQSSAPAITGNTTFHAVFANRSGSAPVASTITGSYSSHTGWSESSLCGSSYWILCSSGKLTSPSISDLSTVTSIVFDARTYGGDSYKTVVVKTSGGTSVGTKNAANNSMSEYTIDVSGLTGSGSLEFSSSTTTAAHGPGINNITINYTTGGYTYSNYATTCVTCDEPDGLTNGAITGSQQTVSWSAPSSAPASGYLVAYSTVETSAPSDTILHTGTRGNYTVIAVAAGTTTTNIPCNAAGTYNWWVRSKCSASSGSDWVAGNDWTMNQIYLQTNATWRNDNAKFAMYYFEGNPATSEGWTPFMTTAPSDCRTGLYTAVMPSTFDDVIFVRFNPDDGTPGWNGDGHVWNQTADLTIPDGKNMFTIPGSDGSSTGNGTNNENWSAYNQYVTIEFDKNTIANGVTDPSDQCVEKSSGNATEPTISDMSYNRLGYQLNGWWTDAEGGTQITFSSQTYSGNTTLYAHWSIGTTIPIALNATWSGDGNTWDKEDAVIIAHCYIDGTTQAQDIVMTGNTCNTYFVANAPYGTTHVSFARCESGTSMLGANWDADDNILNYVAGLSIGGTNTYEITGWGTYGQKVGTASTAGSAYSAPVFTISFAANSGDGTMSDEELGCDDNYTIKANEFTRECYAFTGWTANVDVTINDATVTAGTLITAGSTIQGITSDITLTAQWSQYSCTVTLNKNGGSGSNQTVSATCGSSMPLNTTVDGNPAIVVHTRTGYTLLGYWDTNEESGGKQYYAYDESTSTLSSYADWDKETNTAQNLYARWEANVDHFIDDMHGTTGYTGIGHSESGANYTMPGPLSDDASGNTCETNHYIFVGWVAAEGQNEDGTIGTSSNRIWRPGETKSATNATYYAVWAEE